MEMASNTSQCVISSSTEIKIEQNVEDGPHCPPVLVEIKSESPATPREPDGIKREPVDANLVEIEIEPLSGFDNEIKRESSELSGEAPFRTSNMKFDEESAASPEIDIEVEIKQENYDTNDVTSTHTLEADTVSLAAGSSSNWNESPQASKPQIGQGRLQCDVCQRRFRQPSALMVHQRTHTGEKPFECHECGRGFSRKHDLVLHMRTHRGEEYKPLKCKDCDRRFNKNKDLLIHTRTHTGEQPFQCDQCNRGFHRSYGLFLHMKSHTGEKTLQCKVCQRQFYQKYNLVRHMRTHTGEKPFECETCKQKFSHKHGLLDHIRRHTGEKPHKCNVCQRGFIQKGVLLKHLKTHAEDKNGQRTADKKFYVNISRKKT